MSEQRREPVADRPFMPAGYGVPADQEGMIRWDDLREPLETTKNYWVCTTRPDGRPHAVPIWGAWVDNTFYFEGGPDTRRGKNLAANPAIAVHLERGDLAVMIEGFAEIEHLDDEHFTRVAESYTAKYEYRPESREHWYVVRPKVVLAWEAFPKTTTRFRF